MITIANAQLWVTDQDEALAFYTDKLGMEVRSDVTLPEMGNFRWLTVGPAGQAAIAIVLMPIPDPPIMDAESAEQVRALTGQGLRRHDLPDNRRLPGVVRRVALAGRGVRRAAGGPGPTASTPGSVTHSATLPPDPGQRARHQLTPSAHLGGIRDWAGIVPESGTIPALFASSGGDDRQQGVAVRSGQRLTRTGIEGEDPVDDARPGQHVDTALEERGDGNRGPQQIGVTCRRCDRAPGRAATPDRRSRTGRRRSGRRSPPAGDGRRPPCRGTTARRPLGRDLVPPRGERRIVGSDLAQHVAQAHRVEQADRRARGRPTGSCTPTSRPARRRRWRRVHRRRRSAGSGPRSWPSRRRRRSARHRASGRPADSWPRPAPTRRGGGRRASPGRRAGDDADAPRAVVGRQQQQRHRVVCCRGGPSAAGSDAVRRAEVAAVVDEAAVLAAPRTAGARRASASHCGSAERRPLASTTRSARSSAPAAVTTPATCGTPGTVDGPVSSPVTAVPRTTSSPGSAAAARGDDRLDERSPPGERREATRRRAVRRR